MSSEEDSAAEGQLSFARAKAKRNTSRLPRVDAGEARAVAPPSNGTSLDLRSPPPPMRNGFMSADEHLEPHQAERGGGAHLLRDILQGRRGAEEEDGEEAASADEEEDEDRDEEDDDEEMAAAAAADGAGSARGASDDETDAKKARVESIVSNMRRGGSNGEAPVSAPAPAVNGCKKRKLYQPQQALSGAADDELRLRSRAGAADRDSFRQELLRLKTEVATMQQRYDEMRSEDEDEEMEEDGVASDDSTAAAGGGRLSNNNNNDDDCRELTTPPSELSTDAPRSSPLRDVKPPLRGGDSTMVSPPGSPPDDFRHSRSMSDAPRQTCIVRPPPMVFSQDMERLVTTIKSEMAYVIPRVIDNVFYRFVRQAPDGLAAAATAAAAAAAAAAAVQQHPPPAPTTVARRLDGAPPCRDDQRSMLTQMLDRKSPRTKVLDRNRLNGHRGSPGGGPTERSFYPGSSSTPLKSRHTPPYSSEPAIPEQTEAMSLVVPTKKKRHKVTDTRLVGREPGSPSSKESPGGGGGAGFPPPPLVPVSLNTSVAIPNPSLHHAAADVFFHHVDQPRLYEEQPLPLMLAAAAHSPAEAPPHRYPSLAGPRAPPPPPQDNESDNSQEYDSSMAMMSFLKYFNGAGGPSSHAPAAAGLPGGPGSQSGNHGSSRGDNASVASDSPGFKSLGGVGSGGGGGYTTTLTPMHLRKAKLMFFYVRYPSSAILKMYFPDINFNKNNTAQLVKWFSNFREFYYIQMEKYARQSVSEGIKNVEELKVSADSELLRVLNLHYNRNNHIEVPENFRYVVEQTLREFFRAIVAGKDQEQSWKKAIYKVIARLDDNVPEYFKSPNFLEQLE